MGTAIYLPLDTQTQQPDAAVTRHLYQHPQALNSLGPFVENNAGHARFLAIYATSAVAGSMASYMFCPSMSVGASGAQTGGRAC